MSMLLEGLGNILGPVVGFILGLIPLILVHEFGHLIVGKLSGVWAREFGIGYPPRILKLFRWKETEFTLNWLPFGGFTRFEGETTFSDEDDERDEETKSHSLYAKGPWKRILIYLGGPLTNMLTAWLIAVVIFATGVPKVQTVITAVSPNSPAQTANLQPGDRVLTVNGQPVGDTSQLHSVIQENSGKPTTITVQRDGQTVTVTLVPRENPPQGEGAMGVAIQNEEKPGSLQRYGPGQSFLNGTRYFVNVSTVTAMLPVIIIRNHIPFSQARPVGVVGISQIAEQSVNQSIQQNAAYPFLRVVMMLSISLGIFNLLPIPALDGGRILFSLIEAVRGKALTPELEERIHLVALLVMVVLFVAITVLDIVVPVQLN